MFMQHIRTILGNIGSRNRLAKFLGCGVLFGFCQGFGESVLGFLAHLLVVGESAPLRELSSTETDLAECRLTVHGQEGYWIRAWPSMAETLDIADQEALKA